MKLIIREYLASLRERGELDAILPDLLSELGFNVFSRPRIGTTQYGVDVAAVGVDDDGIKKIFLFSIKRGDLTRQDWDGPQPQSLRSSLNEIRDVYIPTRIPKRYAKLNIVICLCMGGDIQEQVRAAVSGYQNENSTDRISFDEWNGDKMAGLIERGILREELLPKPIRSEFQKAIAFVDEPDVSYTHFAILVAHLRNSVKTQRDRVRVSRQLYVCLWILFVWARDTDNVEAAYRGGELIQLNVWELNKPFIGKKNGNSRALALVINQVIRLHLTIAADYLERKIFPHVSVHHGLSFPIRSQCYVDINRKLFDLLGRIAMLGIWLFWLSTSSDKHSSSEIPDKVVEICHNGLRLIHNNPALFSPISDDQAIDIVLFLYLANIANCDRNDLVPWLTEMVNRLNFAYKTHTRYPIVSSVYRDLIVHPVEQSDEYRREVTAGSTLIPVLFAFSLYFKMESSQKTLIKLAQNELEHCTLQLWLPDLETEAQLYIGEHENGTALANLALDNGGIKFGAIVQKACSSEKSLENLSAIDTGFWPIVLLACRHFRYPVPPQFWVAMTPGYDDSNHQTK